MGVGNKTQWKKTIPLKPTAGLNDLSMHRTTRGQVRRIRRDPERFGFQAEFDENFVPGIHMFNASFKKSLSELLALDHSKSSTEELAKYIELPEGLSKEKIVEAFLGPLIRGDFHIDPKTLLRTE